LIFIKGKKGRKSTTCAPTIAYGEPRKRTLTFFDHSILFEEKKKTLKEEEQGGGIGNHLVRKKRRWKEKEKARRGKGG